MTLCTDTRTEVVDAIEASMIEFFTMMLGEEVTKTSESSDAADLPAVEKLCQEVSVVMGLGGGLTGAVCISMDAEAAFAITKGLIDYEAESVDQTVIDGVGEVANIVVGGAKRRLSDFHLSMSLPNVILAGQKAVKFPTSIKPTVLNFEYRETTMSVLIGLAEC